MPRSPNLAFRSHDHNHCIDSAIAAAQRICEARGARLTALRRQVLQLVWQSHQPLGAYAILEQLGAQQVQEDGKPRRLAPPTVYRALEFLQEQGLVHRLSSLNAFIGCTHPGEHHHSQFLICRQCQAVVEIADDGIDRAIHHAAASAGFADDGAGVEITGLCPRCRVAP
jgi:Fur family zinc uptake transcriptional regulator